MRFTSHLLAPGMLLAALLPAAAQAPPPPAAAPDPQLVKAADSMEERVEQARVQLKNTQQRIEAELLPKKQELDELELQLKGVRDEADRVRQLTDGRALEISNLKRQIDDKKRQAEALGNSIDEYFRSFEARLHISEAKRYEPRIAPLRSDADNSNKGAAERLGARLQMAELSLDRIEAAVGGQRFAGSAADSEGVLAQGSFMLLGPLAFFAGPTPETTGIARSELNSNEPRVTPVPGLDTAAGDIASVVREGRGMLPVDSTNGDALKVAEATDTVFDQIKKGGAVMWPLLGLGGIAVVIGAVKWLQLSRVRRVSARRFHQYMAYLVNGQSDRAIAEAAPVRGPLGKLLNVSAENADEPRELLEEIMYEQVLHARSRLNSFLPFIKVTAAAAPLLGLLGTVSGMINTFKMITIYGTGDAQTFSGGISEALITTQWGLIVAIPCLLLAAFLSRKAKAVTDDMEKLGVAIMNGLPGGGDEDPPTPPAEPPAPRPRPLQNRAEGGGDEESPGPLEGEPQPA